MRGFLPHGITTKKAVYFSSAFIQLILAAITLTFTWDIYQMILESVRMLTVMNKDLEKMICRKVLNFR
jgi:hypothetical protein